MADGDSKSVHLKNTLTAGQVGQEQRMLEAGDLSKYRAGVGKLQFMINEVPEIAYAVQILSKQLVGHARLEAVCAIHVETLRRVAVLDGARQISKDRRGGNDRSLH